MTQAGQHVTPRVARALYAAVVLMIGFSVVSALPFVVERAGFQFLPDPVIHDAWRGWMTGGAGCLAAGVYAVLRVAPAQGRVFGMLRLMAPLVYASMFYVGLTTAVPMVWTALAGQRAAMVVTVAHPTATPTSRCRPAVQLADLPVLFDRLCNVPPTLLMTLNPGDKVLLMGRRSRLGVFYDAARLLPRGEDI